MITVIIISWNTRDRLRACLGSLKKNRPARDCEILVVDNNSSDGSAEMVRSDFPGVRLFQNSGNLGYARACNHGFAAAKGDLLLLLGSDTRILASASLSAPNAIDVMAEFLELHNDAAAAACRLVNSDGSPQHSVRRFPTLWNAAACYAGLGFLNRGYDMADFDCHGSGPVEQPSATCFMINAAFARRIGLFNERYEILYNDVDLCERIYAAGGTIYYAGNTAVEHDASSSTRMAGSGVRLQMYRDILRYFRDRSGATALLVLMPVLMLRLAFLAGPVNALKLADMKKL